MKPPAISPTSRVGIIGGGQLALMLAQACPRLGIESVVFTLSPDDPVRARKGIEIVSDLDDFFEDVDVVTFENEFVNIRELMEYSYEGQRFSPSLAAILRLQDKLSQKKLLNELGIPTSLFQICEESLGAETTLRAHAGKVLKWSRNGYDGKGVLITNDATDAKAVETFFSGAKKVGAAVYAEDKIDFSEELAMVSVRGVSGEIVHYPLVQSLQRAGICREVLGGMKSDAGFKKLENDAREYASRIMNSLNYVGAMAIEYFSLKSKSEICVNEIAPRVHNTGHATIEAANASQFENHLRAISGMPLIAGMSAPFYAMLNLIGKKAEPAVAPKVASKDEIAVHWYGKKETRVGRKMGHLTCVASSSEELQNRLEKMREIEAIWNA